MFALPENIPTKQLLQYVKENFEIHDIFSNEQIKQYVDEYLNIDDLFTRDEIFDWVDQHTDSVTDVFSVQALREWAFQNMTIEDFENVFGL